MNWVFGIFPVLNVHSYTVCNVDNQWKKKKKSWEGGRDFGDITTKPPDNKNSMFIIKKKNVSNFFKKKVNFLQWSYYYLIRKI